MAQKTCLYEIVVMLLLSKNIVLERDVVFERDVAFERDIVFEQNKKLSLLSLLSLPPRKQTLFFNCLQTVFLKTIETIETILGAKNVLI